METQVVFLEMPINGKPVKVRHNGREDYTAVVTSVQQHPSQPLTYRVRTQNGAICVGSLARQTPHYAVLNAPPVSAANNLRRQTHIIIGCIIAFFLLSIWVTSAIPAPPPDPRQEAADAAAAAAQSDTDNGITAVIYSRQIVTNMLKSPSSAEFPNAYDVYVEKNADGNYQFSSYVDSQNSFGAMLRTHYYCVVSVTPAEDDNVLCRLVDIKLNE